jgi:hypothetical protein
MGDDPPVPRRGATLSAATGDGYTKLSDTSLRIVIAEGCVGGNLSALVGKQVHLAAFIGENTLVPGRWFIPDATKPASGTGFDAIKAWSLDLSVGTVAASPPDVVLLGDDDFNSSNFTLFWLRPGDKRVVFRATDYGSVTVAQTITVIAPELQASGVLNTVAVRKLGASAKQFGLGDATHTIPKEWPGIRFEYAVKPPPGGDGAITAVQTIWNGSVVTTKDGTPHFPKFNDFALDTVAPSASPTHVSATADQSFSHWVLPGNSYDNGLGTFTDNNDSPGFPHVERLRAVAANEAFVTFLMYRPDGDSAHSVWVSLGQIAWGWVGAAAEDDNGDWTGSGEPRATLMDNRDLPTWSRVFRGEKAGDDFDPPI